MVDLQFTHAEGDIDLAVYDASGNLVTGSTSVTDNEFIDTILPDSGVYYLEVSYGNAGNTYDLWWDDLLRPSDDRYEENDTLATAYNLSNQEKTWLSTINGAGIQADTDWYQIDVTPGYENLVVDLQFAHAEGDIDLAVYDVSGNLVTGSTSVTDNEYINAILPDSGVYYLEVSYGNAGNTYDLWWDDLLASDA